MRTKYIPKPQKFLYVQKKEDFIKFPPYFIKDARDHRNRLNRS